jgi:hypothetical protein
MSSSGGHSDCIVNRPLWLAIHSSQGLSGLPEEIERNHSTPGSSHSESTLRLVGEKLIRSFYCKLWPLRKDRRCKWFGLYAGYRRLTQYKTCKLYHYPAGKLIDKRPIGQSTFGTMKYQSLGNENTRRSARGRGSARHDLTARQKLFALVYLKDLNGTKAAERAGCSRKNRE